MVQLLFIDAQFSGKALHNPAFARACLSGLHYRNDLKLGRLGEPWIG